MMCNLGDKWFFCCRLLPYYYYIPLKCRINQLVSEYKTNMYIYTFIIIYIIHPTPRVFFIIIIVVGRLLL